MGLAGDANEIMSADSSWHDRVTASIGGAERYGVGCWPNPWVLKQPEWLRKHSAAATIVELLNRKIEMLFEPRFITGVETCELMERLITMIGATQILELGMHTGFGSLHMLRAIVGKPGAKLTSIDARPTHDREFFEQPEIAKHFEFITGWTPDALAVLKGRQFDFVFVDSDHSVDHTQKELAALMPLTHPGSIIAFHDCPAWQTPSHRHPPPVRTYLEGLITSGAFSGMILPSPRQLDGMEEWGNDYPVQSSPGLAVLIRK